MLDGAQKSKQFSPEVPWNCTEEDMIGPVLMKWMQDHEGFYRRWTETWYNNFQFVYGNQSLKWSRRFGYVSSDNFSDFATKAPAMRQRAQTNITRVVLEALSAMIYANLPEWDVEAGEESSVKSKRVQRIIQKLLDAYMVRLCCDAEIGNASRLFPAFGQFAYKIDWNPRGGQLMQIPRFDKQRVPVMTDYMSQMANLGMIDTPTQALNSSGQPLFEQRFMPVLDAMGKQVIDKLFAGDVRFKALGPLEYRRNIGSTGMHDAKSIQHIRLMDYDDYLDEYGRMNGATKFFDRVTPVYTNPAIYNLAVRYFMQLQFTTPPEMDGNVMGGRGNRVYSSTLFKNKVLVVESYDAPHPRKWPLGRKTVVVNGDCTHITVPQYNTGRMDGWHPFVEAQWLNISPSPMAAGPLNDVVAKNKELNIADGLIATMMRRNFGSQLLVKPQAGFDPQRFSGEPGMTHEVLDPYGARWLHDDMPVPAVLPQMRQWYKDDVYDVSGAGEALRGERSPNAPSAYAQRIIEEREERRLATPRKVFENTLGAAGEKITCCLQTNVVELDPQVVGYMVRAGAGEFTVSDVLAFLSTKISYGVEINVKADSMHLRSKATNQATINDLAGSNAAVQQRLQNNPKALDEFLKYFDAETLRDDSSSHRDRAQRENEQFMDMLRLGPQGMSGGIPVVMLADNDDIHIQDHTDFLVQHAEEIQRNPQFFTFIQNHINRHTLKKAEKAGALPNGTSLNADQISTQAAQAKPPGVAQVVAIKQKTDAQAAMAQQAQRQGASAAQRPPGPSGPSQPAPMGAPGGAPPQGAQTPAANMSAAKKGP